MKKIWKIHLVKKKMPEFHGNNWNNNWRRPGPYPPGPYRPYPYRPYPAPYPVAYPYVWPVAPYPYPLSSPYVVNPTPIQQPYYNFPRSPVVVNQTTVTVPLQEIPNTAVVTSNGATITVTNANPLYQEQIMRSLTNSINKMGNGLSAIYLSGNTISVTYPNGVNDINPYLSALPALRLPDGTAYRASMTVSY